MALAGAAWLVGLPPDPEWPDTVERDDLVAALAPAPDLPLDALHTDVVLAVVCTLRRDRLEPYGHDGPTSPFLAHLAQAGVTFEQNFAQAPWTRPSLGSIDTGRWPRVLKLDNPGPRGTLNMVMSDSQVTLAEVLQARGYRTVGAVANPNVKAHFGFGQGFDVYDEPEGTYKSTEVVRGGVGLVDRVLAEADGTPADQRFFARLVFTDSHQPRQAPLRYLALFRSVRDGSNDRRVARYDAAVREVDALLARLYTGLARRRPNLLFVVAADHGEGLRLPKHHGPGHGNYLYRSTIETPLIYRHPALPEPGRRVGGLSMNIDIHPTVLDLLGVATDHPLDGGSEAAAVLGRRDTAVHSRVFAETFFRAAHKSTVFDGDWQLLRDHKPTRGRADYRDALFAASDEGAEHDLRDERPTISVPLAETLSHWEMGMDAASEAGVPAIEVEPDAATIQMLGAMGYVE